MELPSGLAASQAFREANERLATAARELVEEHAPFICECVDTACTGVMRLRMDEYDDVRAAPTRFAVLPGHEDSAERVVARTDRFTVVEKP